MAKICYTKDGNKKSLLSLTERITTPSIHIQKDGNHWYVPLFSGDKGSVIESGDYIYTLGEFKVGSYRAAISRADAILVINNFSIDRQIVSSSPGSVPVKNFYGYKLNISFSNNVTDFKFSSYGNEIDTGVSSSIKPNFYYVPYNYSESIIPQDEWISINSFDPRNTLIWVNSEISQDAVFVLSVRNSIGRESQAYINFRIAPEVEIVQISDGRIYAFVRSCTKEDLYLDYGQGTGDSGLINRNYAGHDSLLSRQEPFEIGTRYRWNSEDLQYNYPQFDGYPANITIFENMSKYPAKPSTDGAIWVYAFPKDKSQCGSMKITNVNLALCDSYYR